MKRSELIKIKEIVENADFSTGLNGLKMRFSGTDATANDAENPTNMNVYVSGIKINSNNTDLIAATEAVEEAETSGSVRDYLAARALVNALTPPFVAE